VPDLEIFPEIWKAKSVRFHAGLELGVLNAGLAVMARIAGCFNNQWLPRATPVFRAASHLFRSFGSANGALAVTVKGLDNGGSPVERRIALISEHDGPAIPCAPAVILARRILERGPPRVGAFPCVDCMTLDEILNDLQASGVRCIRRAVT
jgi:hypothetical protein